MQFLFMSTSVILITGFPVRLPLRRYWSRCGWTRTTAKTVELIFRKLPKIHFCSLPSWRIRCWHGPWHRTALCLEKKTLQRMSQQAVIIYLIVHVEFIWVGSCESQIACFHIILQNKLHSAATKRCCAPSPKQGLTPLTWTPILNPA